MSSLQFVSPFIVATITSLILAIIKFAVYFSTDSLIIMASAFDSLADLLVSLFHSRVEKKAKEKADRRHPYGHGGYEVVSSMGQGVMLIFIALAIAKESIEKLMMPELTLDSLQSNWGWPIAVLVISTFSGKFVYFYYSFYIKKLREKNIRGLSAIADQAHYAGDMIFNALGAIAIWLTIHLKLYWIDALGSLIASLFILYSGWQLIQTCLKDILGEETEAKTLQEIVDIVYSSHSSILSVHRLRSRQQGPNLFIDFHLKLPHQLSLQEAHDIGEIASAQVKEKIPPL